MVGNVIFKVPLPIYEQIDVLISMNTHHKPKYNAKADEALERLYTSARAVSIGDKIRALESIQGTANFYAFGGELNDDMRLGCLEYEYLGEQDLIELVLA